MLTSSIISFRNLSRQRSLATHLLRMLLDALCHLLKGWYQPSQLLLMPLFRRVKEHQVLQQLLVVQCNFVLELKDIYSIVLNTLLHLAHLFFDAESFVISREVKMLFDVLELMAKDVHESLKLIELILEHLRSLLLCLMGCNVLLVERLQMLAELPDALLHVRLRVLDRLLDFLFERVETLGNFLVMLGKQIFVHHTGSCYLLLLLLAGGNVRQSL